MFKFFSNALQYKSSSNLLHPTLSTFGIDLVISYDYHTKANRDRVLFEKSLQNLGITVASETVDDVCFTKIRVPIEMLQRFAEILQIQMPIKIQLDEVITIFEIMQKLIGVQHKTRSHALMLEYCRSREYLYDQDSPLYFNSFVRTFIAAFIVQNHECYKSTGEKLRIDSMINEGIYMGMFALHDGLPHELGSVRHFLAQNWGSYINILRPQPVDMIKDYFGCRMAMYFVLCGFHAWMIFVYMFILLFFVIIEYVVIPTDLIVNEVDDSLYVCPLCPSCKFNRVADRVDLQEVVGGNYHLLFGVGQCILSAVYLHLWRRYSVNYEHRWGLLRKSQHLTATRREFREKFGEDDDYVQPNVPFWTFQLPMTLLGVVTSLFSIICVFVVMILLNLFFLYFLPFGQQRYLVIYVIEAVKTLSHFISGIVLEYVFTPLFVRVTYRQVHRTITEHMHSLFLKRFAFQIFNDHAFILSNLLFKINFGDIPRFETSLIERYMHECLVGFCTKELLIRISLYPIFAIIWRIIYRRYIVFLKIRHKKSALKKRDFKNRFMDSYHLLDWDVGELDNLYLELIKHYTIMSFYLTIVPTLVLVQLFTHMIDMRFTAKTLLKYYKRPVGEFEVGLGFWLYIFHVVSMVTIIVNALILAFLLPIAPKIAYFCETGNRELNGFFKYFLSAYPIARLYNGTVPPHAPENQADCYYMAYRYPPKHQEQFELSRRYWVVTVVRMAIMLVFIVLVKVAANIVMWIFPKIPQYVRLSIAREQQHISECVKYETLMKKAHTGDSHAMWRMQQHPLLERKSSGESLLKRRATIIVKPEKDNGWYLQDDDDVITASEATEN